MRLILDTCAALMLVAVLGGIIWQHRGERLRAERIESVRQAIEAIESQSLYRAALGDTPATVHGYAERIDPAWFHPIPRNLLLKDSSPWLDQAVGEERKRFHPARIVAEGTRAAFWYNPGRGEVRARVPMQLSHEATVELYNRINGSSLHANELEWPGPPPPAVAAGKPAPDHPPQTADLDPVMRDFAADGG